MSCRAGHCGLFPLSGPGAQRSSRPASRRILLLNYQPGGVSPWPCMGFIPQFCLLGNAGACRL